MPCALGSSGAREPKKGGLLRIGVSGDSLGPWIFTDQVPVFTGYALSNPLVEVDNRGRALGRVDERHEREARRFIPWAETGGTGWLRAT